MRITRVLCATATGVDGKAKPAIRPTRALLSVSIVALLGLSGCETLERLSPPDVLQISTVERVIWLDQGWSDNDRHWAHHASQGTATIPIPYTWFVALEQPSLTLWWEADPFVDPAYLSRFGFIPSPVSTEALERGDYGYSLTTQKAFVRKYADYTDYADDTGDAEKYGENPDGLPVGFARLKGKDPMLDGVGFTCAACHTGQLEYKGVSVRIDGGPAMTDLEKFRKAIGVAIAYTKIMPGRLNRFVDRVLGSDASESDKADLKAAFQRRVQMLSTLSAVGKLVPKGVDEGFTRLDALTRIGNRVFSIDLMKRDEGVDFSDLEKFKRENADAISNNRPMVAPVNFPHIWGTSWFDWVQYDASIMQPMIRNAGEALGVSARVNLVEADGSLYQSTVNVSEIFELEKLLAGPNPMLGEPKGFNGLQAPEWPEAVLGDIDHCKASEGRRLYDELCMNCHLPLVDSEDFWADHRWTDPNAAQERYLKVKNIPLTYVGTDPAQAKIMTDRRVTIPAHLGVPPIPEGMLCYDAESMSGSTTETLFAWALGVVVEKTVTAWYDAHEVSPGRRDEMNGYRPNCLKAELAYKARPLDGIWATAPFLHNGAVPTLFDLLSPVEERPRKFWLGSRRFDPVKVGYETKKLDGGFELDTSIPGNWNKGHEFGPERTASGVKRKGVIGRKLSAEERYQLVEFLKTL